MSPREQAAKVLRHLPSPSSYSHPKGSDSWSGPKGFSSLLRCHRIPSAAQLPFPVPLDEHLAEVPVTLLDPILAQLAEDCEHMSPSAADCSFTEWVAESMSRAYGNEDSGINAVWDLFLDEFGCSLVRMTVGNGKTDGSYISCNVLVLNLAIKNEIGMGRGSPHIQNAVCSCSYASSVGSKLIRDISVCPTLLVELAGPNMSLSGSIFSACAICDQLTPMVSLLWLPHSPLMLQAARCFGALRKALRSLENFYTSLSQYAEPDRQLQYPYPNIFTALDGTHVTFQYTSALTPRCFTAQACQQQLVVKFTRTYSSRAHRFLAEQGFAPRLLHTRDLPGRWVRVGVLQSCTTCSCRWVIVRALNTRAPLAGG